MSKRRITTCLAYHVHDSHISGRFVWGDCHFSNFENAVYLDFYRDVLWKRAVGQPDICTAGNLQDNLIAKTTMPVAIILCYSLVAIPERIWVLTAGA